MKPAFLLACLLIIIIFAGCSTPQGRVARDSKLEEKRLADEENNPDFQNLQLKVFGLEISNNCLKEVEATLEEQNTALENTNAILLNEVSNYEDCVAINDYLQENKTALIGQLQEQWSTNCTDLFSAAGGSGQILKFQVEDIFLYKGFVVVNTIYLWSNTDGSGGVGRVAMSFDPAKDFDVAGCQMLGRVLISQDELASLTHSDDTQEVRQIEETDAANIPEKPMTWVSDETKNDIVKQVCRAGIGLIVMGIEHYMNSPTTSDQDSGSVQSASGQSENVNQSGNDNGASNPSYSNQ